jgi:hypothetical protein
MANTMYAVFFMVFSKFSVIFKIKSPSGVASRTIGYGFAVEALWARNIADFHGVHENFAVEHGLGRVFVATQATAESV